MIWKRAGRRCTIEAFVQDATDTFISSRDIRAGEIFGSSVRSSAGLRPRISGVVFGFEWGSHRPGPCCGQNRRCPDGAARRAEPISDGAPA